MRRSHDCFESGDDQEAFAAESSDKIATVARQNRRLTLRKHNTRRKRFACLCCSPSAYRRPDGGWPKTCRLHTRFRGQLFGVGLSRVMPLPLPLSMLRLTTIQRQTQILDKALHSDVWWDFLLELRRQGSQSKGSGDAGVAVQFVTCRIQRSDPETNTKVITNTNMSMLHAPLGVRIECPDEIPGRTVFVNRVTPGSAADRVGKSSGSGPEAGSGVISAKQ